MSPIGRVFIVLNLALAGGFAVFAGTHLQKQYNYKNLLTQEKTARAEETEKWSTERTRLEQDRITFENAKTANETNFKATKDRLDSTEDENKRLHQQLASLEGDIKAIVAVNSAIGTETKTAFEKAAAAYAMATADQKVRDEAVNAKNTAEAENRTLKTTIASLEDTVKGKEVAIANLEKERSELNLLVSVATQKGFVPSMAAPSLAGMVTNASHNLCTIQIQDNPGNVDIADQIAKRSFSFAIYDASGYKGEAVATKYEPTANAVLCNLFLVKGDIKEGDKAATKTP